MLNGFIVYNSLLLIIVFFCFAAQNAKNYSSEKLGYFLPLLILTLFCGFRYGVGTDYFSYIDVFHNGGVDNAGTEIGWIFFNRLFGFWKHGYLFVFLISSAITYYSWIKIFKKENIFLWGMFFLIVYGYVMYANNAVRQAITIPILYYSLNYIVDRKPFRFVLIVLVCGFLIHKSAFIILPFYFINRTTDKKWFWITIVIVGLILYFSNFTIVIRDFLIGTLKDISPGYWWYLVRQAESGASANMYTVLPIILRGFIAISLLLFTDLNKNPITKIYLKISLIAFVIGMLSIDVKIFDRVYNLFDYVNIILYAQFMTKITTKNSLIFKLLLVLIFLLLFQAKFIVNSHNCVPYKLIFFNF
jgi:hypothetical protein